jgi:hypothetical protein
MMNSSNRNGSRSKVVCVRADSFTDPTLQLGQVYDLLDVVQYGPVEFFRVGVRGLWSVLNPAYDFRPNQVS